MTRKYFFLLTMMAVDSMSSPVLSQLSFQGRRASFQSPICSQRLQTENEKWRLWEVIFLQQTTPSSASGASNNEQPSANANFECNICLDTAKDAVISFCGHLFWWEFGVFCELDRTRIHSCFICAIFRSFTLFRFFIFYPILAGHVFTRFVSLILTLFCGKTKHKDQNNITVNITN